MTDAVQRRRIEVTGVVQGVGYRPFVFRLARLMGLAGFVQNTGRGVVIEIEGEPALLVDCERRLAREAPPLARLSGLSSTPIAARGDREFVIRASVHGPGRAGIPPDLGPCAACDAELRAPTGRRRSHAFISCTDCGPRYSIVESLPFDRAATSMSAMPMCARCKAEFADVDDRRFHAQTIACPECGPRLAFTAGSAGPFGTARASVAPEAALAAAMAVLQSGGILAVKGVGAYHLACDAASAPAIRTLRQRKGRPDKPLAVLVPDLPTAHAMVALSAAGAAALTSAARPIVLAPPQPSNGIAAGATGEVASLGVMLPPSPLHVVLAEGWRAACPPGASGALVMTSANASDAPAIVDDEEAASALVGIADGWLSHDRPIVTRSDDSVLLDAGPAGLVPIRLARGVCPARLPLRSASRPLLAVGGEFKAACCLAFDGQAVLAPHVGDIAQVASLEAMSDTVDHVCRLLGVEPEIYVCDAHPGYLSSRWADDAAGGRAERVQHHHAHAASLMAEHGLARGERLVTVCFDGTGYGDDRAIWGGEVLDAAFEESRRLAHLEYAPLPGGDAAIRYPARAAFAYLRQAGVPDADGLPCGRALSAEERRVLARQVDSAVHVTPTSSMGRLFDVVAATCGLATTCSFEGQAALRLEAEAARAGTDDTTPYSFEWRRPVPGAPVVVAWTPVLRAVATDMCASRPVPAIAAAFHRAVADLVVGITTAVAPDARRVGLSGGVFQNARLLQLAVEGLRARGIAALTHVRVPPNDGGLSLGQAAVAASRLAAKEPR